MDGSTVVEDNNVIWSGEVYLDMIENYSVYSVFSPHKQFLPLSTKDFEVSAR